MFGLLVDLLPLTQDLGEYETVCQCFIDCVYPNYKSMVSGFRSVALFVGLLFLLFGLSLVSLFLI